MQGTVKWFNETKGFGFILGDDNNEYFVHASKLKGCETLKENDRVCFEPTQTLKGNQAFDVELYKKRNTNH